VAAAALAIAINVRFHDSVKATSITKQKSINIDRLDPLHQIFQSQLPVARQSSKHRK